MVSQLRSLTPSRRVTRSQSVGQRQPNPKKSRRVVITVLGYVEMRPESEQEEIASTEPEFIRTILPERLFARNCHPSKPQLKIYSKASIIGSLVKSLKGSPEMNCLLGSQFRALFHLPVSRCSNSAKLVHSILSRQLVTFRRYELWFLFTDNPLRFSLREFGDTGLKCEPEVEKVGNDSEPGRTWRELFETEEIDASTRQFKLSAP